MADSQQPRIRIYIGNLDPGFTQTQMENEVSRFGPTKSVWVAKSPAGFAFVEFETEADAQACIDGLHECKLGQSNVVVQFAKTSGRKEPPKPTPIRSGASGTTRHRAVLKNLPPSFSWRELKEEMRQIGNVIYADIDPQGDGIVEFSSATDLDYAVQRLDGSSLDGNIVSVFRESYGAQASRAAAAAGAEEERALDSTYEHGVTAGYEHGSRTGYERGGGVGYDRGGGAEYLPAAAASYERGGAAGKERAGYHHGGGGAGYERGGYERGAGGYERSAGGCERGGEGYERGYAARDYGDRGYGDRGYDDRRGGYGVRGGYDDRRGGMSGYGERERDDIYGRGAGGSYRYDDSSYRRDEGGYRRDNGDYRRDERRDAYGGGANGYGRGNGDGYYGSAYDANGYGPPRQRNERYDAYDARR